MAVQNIAWISLLPRWPVADQVAAVMHDKQFPVNERNIVVNGRRLKNRSADSWEQLTKLWRKDDVLVVVDLRALAACPAPKKLQPGRRMLHGVRQVEVAQLRIYEASTRLRLWIASERDEALMAARDRMERAAQGVAGGRNKRPWTAEQRAFVMKFWPSLKYPTNQAAIDAMQIEAGKQGVIGLDDLTYPEIMIRHFGNSGRSALRRRAKR
jgi:hypothetical protein